VFVFITSTPVVPTATTQQVAQVQGVQVAPTAQTLGVQNLPRTGSAGEARQSGTLIAMGLLMVVAGTGLFFAGRKTNAG
jgi:hypothetical protein